MNERLAFGLHGPELYVGRFHPQYGPVVFNDLASGEKVLTRSTATSSKTIEWEDGNTYPVIDVEISSASHPFWTGKQRLLDTLCRQASMRRALPWVGAAAVTLVAVTSFALSRANEAVTSPPPEEPSPRVVLPFDEVTAAVDESEQRAAAAHDAAQSLGASVAAGVASRAVERAAKPADADTSPRLVMHNVEAPTVRPIVLQPAPEPDPKDQGTNSAAIAKHLYRFSVVPAGANFYVDGRQVEVMRALTGIELSEGEHVLTASGSGARRWGQRLEVAGPQPASQTPMPIVLTYEDATVTVVSNVAAIVWFDGEPMRKIGAHGRNATFTVPFGSADSTASELDVRLKVASQLDMGRPKMQTIAVTPGQRASVNFNFEPRP